MRLPAFLTTRLRTQALIDISTPGETFERVDAAVTAHLIANPGEFTGKHLVVANFAADPLKFTLCVWWEYAHTGTALVPFLRKALPKRMSMYTILFSYCEEFSLQRYGSYRLELSDAMHRRYRCEID